MERSRRSAKLNDVAVCAWWEQVSAATDGELDATERDAALAHAQRCSTCAVLLTFEGGRAESSTPLPFAADTLTPRERRWLNGRWTRWLLMAVAVVIVAEAVPAYIRGDGLSAEAHAARHLASWQIGFGVGVFVAAWMSRMSHAMLALAATFAALTVVATAIDVISGHQGPWAESVHLVELVAVFLLWRLTPPHLLPWNRRTDRLPARQQNSASPELRLVRREPDATDDQE